MNDDCEHEWHCPGPITGNGPQGAFAILPLYCKHCAQVMSRLLPAPEVDEKERARQKLLHPHLAPVPFGKK